MKKIKASVVKAKLQELGFPTVLSTDAELFCPSRKWLADHHTPHLQQLWKATLREDARSKGEATDCDDYAIVSKSSAILANAARVNAFEGMAFGVASVGMLSGASLNGIPGPGGHVTNFVVTMESDSDEPMYLFYEPQNGNYCPMEGSLGDFSVVPMWALF
jgi:hypothetical protein